MVQIYFLFKKKTYCEHPDHFHGTSKQSYEKILLFSIQIYLETFLCDKCTFNYSFQIFPSFLVLLSKYSVFSLSSNRKVSLNLDTVDILKYKML